MRPMRVFPSAILFSLACCGGGGSDRTPGVGGGELVAVLSWPDPAFPADPTTEVVVTFNRLMDQASLLASEAASLWFRRDPVPWTGLDVQRRVVEDQAQGRTSLLFLPSGLLPAGADLKVALGAGIRDRAGLALKPVELGFSTVDSGDPPLILVEEFLEGSMADEEAGSLNWASGLPGLRPGRLGGSGLLGEFVAPPGETVIRTEESTWPATATLSGQERRVSNGVFFFQRFEVPAGATLRFVGSYPVRLFVAGDTVVFGSIVAHGFDAEPTDGGRSTPRGGDGGQGGPGGGSGGSGGGQPMFSRVRGFPGAGMALPPGHPDQMLGAACAGQGAEGHPSSGLSQDLIFGPDDRCRMAAAGGGGASAVGAGLPGRVVRAPEPLAVNAGSSSAPSQPFPFLPLRARLPAELQFLFGGAGGGGGGAHPFLHVKDPFGRVDWHAAGGGGGGGGALQIRSGGRIFLGSGSLLSVRGGSGSDENTNYATPGGGGSGGSLLLQAGGAILLGGSLDVRGGSGGRLVDESEALEVVGGDGGPGFLRIESDPRLPANALTGVLPTPGEESSGLLEEKDPVTSGRSRIYRVKALAPRYVRYELEVQEGFFTRVYSDDPGSGIVPIPGLTPVGIAFQGVRLDSQGQPLAFLPWRGSPTRLAGPDEPAPQAWRFSIWFDTAQIGHHAPLEVRSLKVFYRP